MDIERGLKWVFEAPQRESKPTIATQRYLDYVSVMTNLPTYSNEYGYQVYDCNTDPNEFGVFQSFVELWNSKRENTQLPAWRDFKFNDFVGWYGWISVCDVSFDPVFDTHYRLWGTNVADFNGYDLTGESPRINTVPPFEYSYGFDQEDFDFLETLVKQSAIGTAFGACIYQNRSHMKYKEITLPLADDGQTVDKLLFLTNPVM